MSERAYRVYQRYLKNMEQGINRKFASSLTYYSLFPADLRFSFMKSFTFGKTFRSWKMKNRRNSEPLTMIK